MGIDYGRFHHSKAQAESAARNYNDDEWVAIVKETSAGMFSITLYERDTGEIVAKNI
jgi:hypothetical protein